MKSNVCKIENGTKDLAAILKESEKVAVYNDLDHKQTLHLRLICEEIDGLLPNLIDNFAGEFWIEFENGVCKVNVSLNFDMAKRSELVEVSTNKKNAAAVGIVGKIRASLENIFLDEESVLAISAASNSYYFATEYHNCMSYSSFWTLEQYRNEVKADKDNGEKWDELEKSVLASVADDIIVGLKGKQADIVIIKKFA